MATQTPGLLVTLFPDVAIPETDGKATIAQARSVFPGCLDSNFKNWGTDQPSPATPSMTVTVSEMHWDATFKQIFVPPNGGKTLDDLCLTQAQIIDICKKHPDKLGQGDSLTFFLFKVDRPELEDPKYFVARVRVDGRGLGADVLRFDDPYVWYAGRRPRVVLPQLQ